MTTKLSFRVAAAVAMWGFSNPCHATIYQLTDLGDASAHDINNSGQVVGSTFFGGVTHAFLWTSGGGFQDLGDLPGGADLSGAIGINSTGQVVGTGDASTGHRAALWPTAGSPQNLGDLPGGLNFSEAYDINDNGRVVGRSI